MKKSILYLIFVSVNANYALSQTVTHSNIKASGNFTEYISKNGTAIKVNDTVHIGYPSNGSLFNFITQGDQPAAKQISNTKNVINKIKVIGNTKRGYKVFLLFSGYGLLPVYIDYESALETAEIKGIISKKQ